MMQSKSFWLFGALLLFIVTACLLASGCCCPDASPACGEIEDHDEVDDDGQPVAVSELPANVVAAATAAVPGLLIEEAALETEDGVTFYDIEGEVGEKDYELEITPAGKVLDVEEDHDGDDEDDDGDDEEDDDGAN